MILYRRKPLQFSGSIILGVGMLGGGYLISRKKYIGHYIAGGNLIIKYD